MIPAIHSENSVKRYGGVASDYSDIHTLMDSTKCCISSNKHRFLTHNSWFITSIIPLIFGERRKNSDGKWYNTKDVCEYHVLEDFRMRFIPTPQDYAEHMSLEGWMNNGAGTPNRLKNDKTNEQKNNLNQLFD